MAFLDLSPDHLTNLLTAQVNDILPRIPIAIATFVIGLLIIRILSWIGSKLIGLVRMPRGLKSIIVSLVDAVLMIFLIIVTLQSLGLNNVAFAFSAAIAAIGLALGNGSVAIVQDILAGIFLAQDPDFSVGDEIRISDTPGGVSVQGVVEAMDMRRTRVRGEKGFLHVFPNSYIERREWVLIAKKRDRKV